MCRGGFPGTTTAERRNPHVNASSPPPAIPAPGEPWLVGSLCSGIGGFEKGLEATGLPFKAAWFAEFDPEPAKILARRFPDVPNLPATTPDGRPAPGDISLIDWDEVARTRPVHCVIAGFPCTDVSAAGKQEGLIPDVVIPAGQMLCGCQWADHQPDCDDASTDGYVPARLDPDTDADLLAVAIADLNTRDRNDPAGPPPERTVKGTRSGVWSYVRNAIRALRPAIVFIENVKGLLNAKAHSDVEPCPWCVGDPPDERALRALGAVLGDLADLGYDATWYSLPAAAVGAPHLRWRVFIVATPLDLEGNRVGDPRPEGWQGIPAAAVGGAVRSGSGWLTDLLPTPAASTPNDGEDPDTWEARRAVLAARHGNNGAGMPLAVAAQMLPTPRARDAKGITRDGSFREGTEDLPTTVAELMPTPRARDFKGGDSTARAAKGGPNQRGSSGDLMLPSAVMEVASDSAALLPTVRAQGNSTGRRALAASKENGRRTGGGQSSPLGLDQVAALAAGVDLTGVPDIGDLPPATVETIRSFDGGDRWGRFAPAITRWEHTLGRPAPAPTEPNREGNQRLSPAFVEWMMGYPAGWVTDLVADDTTRRADPAAWISRSAALRGLGNAICPQQIAAAVPILLAAHFDSEVSA